RETMQRLVLPDELLAEEEAARKAEAMAVRAYATAAGQRSLRRLRATKKQVAAAQAQVEAVAEKIQRLQKSAAQVVYGHADSLDVLQKRLAPNQALVVYAWTYRGVYALVVTPDAARTVELGSTEAVGKACAAFDGRNVKQQPDAALAQLRALLAEPLALPEQTTEVLISPAGDLGYVPFALVFPKHVTVCVPSGTTHGLLREQGALRGEQVLAVGDPNYGAKPTGAASRHRGAWRGRLTPLPATRTEVEAVGTVKLLGDRATEAGVRAAVAGRTRWRAIHFACHGLVDPEQPSLSCLALTPHGQDDGFLTCHDVFRQPMPADLVVLSACETGRGKVYAAEGIVGLTRAFMFAGAPRVICSLWKVDDDATRALMVEFYRLWQANAEKGLSAAQALKQAQEYVRTFEREEVDREASRKARRTVMRKVRPWQHPYYWAAWVLWGLPE
nr:CHAT domain-containing protein [Planctomycetota bacterium]